MKAIGQDHCGRVVVVVNSDEPDPDRWDAVIVDVHNKSYRGMFGSSGMLCGDNKFADPINEVRRHSGPGNISEKGRTEDFVVPRPVVINDIVEP